MSYQLGYSLLADYLNEIRYIFIQLIFNVLPGTVLAEGYITVKQNDMVIPLRRLILCWRIEKCVGSIVMGVQGVDMFMGGFQMDTQSRFR